MGSFYLLWFGACLGAQQRSISVDTATSNLVITAGEGSIEMRSSVSIGEIVNLEQTVTRALAMGEDAAENIPKLELKIVNSIAAAETSTDDKVAALDASVATRMGVMRDDLEAAVAAAVAVVDDKVTEEQVLGEGRFQALVTDISKIKEGAQSTASAKAASDTKVTSDIADLAESVKQLSTATSAITNALYGSVAGIPASSCGTIREKRASAADGANYYLKTGNEVFRAECKTNSKDKFVSIGGNGKTQASAAAGCGGNTLVEGNSDDKKWIDPDADAENTENAEQTDCIVSLVPWGNDNCNPPEGTGAIASQWRAEQRPCKAFDADDDPDSQNNGGDFWQTNPKSQQGAWLGWNWGTKTKVQIKEFLVDNNYTPRVFHNIALEGSNDGSSWELIMYTGKIDWTAHNQAKTFQVGDKWKQKPAYHMVRIFNYEYDSSGSHALIGALKFVGFKSSV